MSLEELSKEYLARKICYKCKRAQSSKRTTCFYKYCGGDLRYRKKGK